MEALQALRDKIEQLLTVIQSFKSENARLENENKQFSKKVALLEASIKEHSLSCSELNQEKEETRLAVDELIKCIDSFVSESRQ